MRLFQVLAAFTSLSSTVIAPEIKRRSTKAVQFVSFSPAFDQGCRSTVTVPSPPLFLLVVLKSICFPFSPGNFCYYDGVIELVQYLTGKGLILGSIMTTNRYAMADSPIYCT